MSEENWMPNRSHYTQVMAIYEPPAQKDNKINNKSDNNITKMEIRIIQNSMPKS
jgi:hypothetical protein